MYIKKLFVAAALFAATTTGLHAADFLSPAFVTQIDASRTTSIASLASVRNAFSSASTSFTSSMELVGETIRMAESIPSVRPGNANLALVWQDGLYNDAQIQQTGLSNVALVRQIGSYNMASVQQTGNGHQAVVFQQGTGNVAIIRQR